MHFQLQYYFPDRSERLLQALILTCVFIGTLVVQFWIWGGPFPYTDALLWTTASQQFADGSWPNVFAPVPPHPGTTITTATAFFMDLNLRNDLAMRSAMALLMAASITTLTYLCRLLRPKSLWWLGVAGFFALNPLYLQMSAPSALAGILVCIFVLLLLYAREHGASPENTFYLGLTMGILLATRIDTGAGLVLCSLPYAWPLLKQHVFKAAGYATLFFAALDVYIWQHPILHFWSMLSLVGSNTVTSVVFEFHLWAVYFAIGAFLLGLIIAYIRPALSSLPIDFLKWTLAWTALLSALMLLSRSHPIRYFFPMMAVWELLLPLMILEVIDAHKGVKVFEPLERSKYAAMALLWVLRIVMIYTLWVQALGPLFYRVV